MCRSTKINRTEQMCGSAILSSILRSSILTIRSKLTTLLVKRSHHRKSTLVSIIYIDFVALMKTVEKTFGLFDSTMTTGVIINLILAVVIRAPMKQMWNMINTLQILTFMPMLNIQLPTNLRVCLSTIKEVSNLSIIPKGGVDWLLE